MTDDPIAFDSPVEDDRFNAAFNSGRADRGGRHRVPVATDPNAARLLPPYIPPHRDAPSGTTSPANSAP